MWSRNDNTVRYDNRSLQIPADRQRHHYVKAEVRVHEYPDGQLAVFHGPRCLARYKADSELDRKTSKDAGPRDPLRRDQAPALWISGQLGHSRPDHFPTGPTAATEAVN